MPQVDPTTSFGRFVYPFLFEGDAFGEHADRIEGARWEGRERALDIWSPQAFPNEDLLAHVAEYLNPDGKSSQPPTARLWNLHHDALISPAGLGAGARWSLSFGRGEVPFSIRSCQLALFAVGVGFLTVHTRLSTSQVTDWLDFIHYFRFMDGQRNVSIRLQRRTGREEFCAYFPPVAGGLESHAEGHGLFSEMVIALLRTGGALTACTPWWRDVFVPGRLLPFVSLFLDSDPTEPILTDEDKAVFAYKLRNFFHSRQDTVPTDEDLRLESNPAVLPYVRGQWFIFSLDGGVFLAGDAPRSEFFRKDLPDHLRSHYFLLFVLVLHQRFAMMMLLDKIAQHWLVDEKEGIQAGRDTAFERIQDAFLVFTARGYFAQVMQRDHHHQAYRKWQDTLQVERLYREIGEAVSLMNQHLQLKRSERLQDLQEQERKQAEAVARFEDRKERAAEERAKRLEQRLNQIVLILGLPALALTYLDVTSPGVSWQFALSVCAVITLLGAIVLVWLNRSDRRRRR